MLAQPQDLMSEVTLNTNSLQSARREFWHALGSKYACLIGATISNAQAALNYTLTHDWRAAHLYDADPDPAEAKRLFGEAFSEELSSIRSYVEAGNE